MKKIELSEEELETMNYNDIAFLVLENKGKKMKLLDLFQEVCKILGVDSNECQEKVTDLFELLSTDKRFIMLDGGYWDLRIKHNKGMVIESDDEDEEDLVLDEDDGEVDEDYSEEDKESDDDVDEDDLSDLVIIDDVDDENNM